MQKKIIIITIVVLVLVNLGILHYTFIVKPNNNKKFYDKNITGIDIINEFKDSNFDVNKNSDKIISAMIKKYEYKIVQDSFSLTGNIYIDADEYLYISDSTKKTSLKLSNVKFKTLYRKNNTTDFFRIYAISEDSRLYVIFLSGIEMEATSIYEIDTPFNVLKFTTLEFENIGLLYDNNIIVLADDNVCYDAISHIKYDDSIKSLNNEFYVYRDNSITNSYGKLLRNNKDELYKIKYYIYLVEGKENFNNTNSIIITEDNKIIYQLDKENILYEYNKTIKKIDYEEKNGEFFIKINFNDDSSLNIIGLVFEQYSF